MSNSSSSSSSDRAPLPLSSGDIPSSFDDTEFFEESRTAKLWRKLRQEPLIPLGGLATCYALYMATKSIRAGDHHQTNRMFRARIYAQGFTLVAIVAGSIFYQDERMKRRKFDKALEDKKALEKREKWLRELEMRDAEDRAWRERIEGAERDAWEAAEAAKEKARQVKRTVEDSFSSKSMRWSNSRSSTIRDRVGELGWGDGMGLWRRTSEAWRRL